MRRLARVAVLSLSALAATALPSFAAGTAELLADIEVAPGRGSSPRIQGALIPLGDRLLFEASEESSGTELWVSDTTNNGTRLLSDLAPGRDSSAFFMWGTVGRTAVFLHGRNGGPSELWRSDGTVAGTFPLYGESRLEGCSFRDLPEAVQAGGEVFFLAAADPVQCGLWKTDGTIAGTRLIEDIGAQARTLVAAGPRVFFFSEGGLWTGDDKGAVLLRSFSTEPQAPRRLQASGSRIAFTAQAAEGEGEELWLSDGTVDGTRALTRFFEPFPFGFSSDSEVFFLKTIGNTLYFTADDGTGVDLWRSDGPGAIARRMTDFIADRPFGEGLEADRIARIGDRLIFIASEEGHAEGRLWVSGGTPESTVPLDGCPDGCPRFIFSPLIQLGDRILFEAFGSNGFDVIWKTDGTATGTERLADFGWAQFQTPVLFRGRVFFIGPGRDFGQALWKTDGTVAGTVRVAELGQDPFEDFEPLEFSPVFMDGRMFFVAESDEETHQIWVSDGSAAGTRAIPSISGSSGSFPRDFTPFAAGVLFRVEDRFGEEGSLWRTDGTTAGTHPIRNVFDPRSIATASNGLAFLVTEQFNPLEIWRTDGTEAGTFRVDPPGLEPLDALVPFGDGAAFVVEKEEGFAIWASDGTVAGTRLLFDLPDYVSSIRAFRAFGPRLYFVANNESFNEDLWVSDGTAAGTRPLAGEEFFDFRTDPEMVEIGGTVYFADFSGLWKTDGTVAGTSGVLLPQSFDDLRPRALTEFDGALYFIARLQESQEIGLWRTDGTPAGTILVAPIPGEDDFFGDPIRMARVGGRLVFTVDDGVHGLELWVSDGTGAGTGLLRDIVPGEASALPPSTQLAVAGDKAYFSATDGTSGFELWESDGTAAGTRRVQDIAPQALSSSPSELAVVGNRLFFAANDGVHGEEPWILPLQKDGCVPSATALCLGGRFRVEADWRDFDGNRGRGTAVKLTADTGTFWFFNAANVEVVLKVLDGRGVNGHHWVFYGALSNVEYVLTVTDTATGAVRRYSNPLGRLGSLADTEAFGPRGASLANPVTDGPAARPEEAQVSSRAAPAAGSCAPGPRRLCLNNGRFVVEARWRRPDGSTGTGQAVPLAGGDTGYFWFFDANNVEVVLKVLDGRPVNDRFWVFYGALSDVEYTLTVTDTETGAVRTYTNPSGRLASVADTGAF